MTWDPKKYFAKAQLAWRSARSCDQNSSRYVLELSFFVEYISRGALVKKNPVLNSAVDEDSLMFSAGVQPKRPPKSISIDQGLTRLRMVVPEISDAELGAIRALMVARNEELHGDADGMTALSSQQFIAKVMSFLVRVSEAVDEDLASIVGNEDALHSKEVAEAAQKDRAKRAADLIKIQRDRFYSLGDESQKQKRAEGLPGFQYAIRVNGAHQMAHSCPACSNLGLLTGKNIGASEAYLFEGDLVSDVRAQPIRYDCICCGLSLNGLDEVLAAGMPHEFSFRISVDPVEFFGIDPLDYVDRDEIIREFVAADEYQDE